VGGLYCGIGAAADGLCRQAAVSETRGVRKSLPLKARASTVDVIGSHRSTGFRWPGPSIKDGETWWG